MSRMNPFFNLALMSVILGCVTLRSEGYYLNRKIEPPSIEREFRGVWVATVGNLDWPSKPGLSSEQQQSELIKIFDRALSLNLNAVVLQVRSVGDALYSSESEPWSYYLTGEMGRAPEPIYDPLAFAIHHAHLRGLELHAWINPFRVGLSNQHRPQPASHVTKRHPEWVREFGKYLWLDPGEPAVETYLVGLVSDLVDRYDVDGIHIDDYFYPDPALDSRRLPLKFPDDSTFQAYRQAGGKDNLGEWRRQNVNRIVRSFYQAIKSQKPWVKFGVSPKGIWQPGYPEGIVGMNAFHDIFADSRLWLQQGWLDYFAPQLYWSIDDIGQQFPLLLHWWSEQNILGRHLWPGLATYKAGEMWANEEILNQASRTRIQKSTQGNIHYRMSGLMDSSSNSIGTALKRQLYPTPAMVPSSPWLTQDTPNEPKLKLTWRREQETLIVQWMSRSRNPIGWHVVQAQFEGRWYQQVLPHFVLHKEFSYAQGKALPTYLAIRDVDRFGQEGPPVVLEFHASTPDP